MFSAMFKKAKSQDFPVECRAMYCSISKEALLIKLADMVYNSWDMPRNAQGRVLSYENGLAVVG